MCIRSELLFIVAGLVYTNNYYGCCAYIYVYSVQT